MKNVGNKTRSDVDCQIHSVRYAIAEEVLEPSQIEPHQVTCDFVAKSIRPQRAWAV